MKKFPGFFFLIAVLFFLSCGQDKPIPTFDTVAGIKFTEIRRSYDTGSSFSKSGFQQNPEWIIYFMKKDSARIYSPKEKRFIHYIIYHDHDSVFNFAREWFRMKVVTKDSVILQLLKVEDNHEISKEMSNVYMKFYAENYLRKLRADPEKMKLPNAFDTLYIRRKSDMANRNPTVLDSLFAGRTQVRFISRSAAVRVEQQKPSVSVFENPNPADIYLHPEYSVKIAHAFKDFYYSYVASVDEKGMLRTLYSLQPAEDMTNRLKNIDIVNSFYIQRNVTIQPASTLGIQHASKIVMNVEGTK